LLCSDGVVDGLYDSQIDLLLQESSIGSAARNPARQVVEAAVEISGRDNTTALVIEVSS
jgi:protein phosphatase